MPKTITQKNRQEGPVATAIKDLTGDERLAAKVQAYANMPKNVSFSKDGYQVTVTQVQAVGTVLSVWINVLKNGVPVSVPNPFQFVNPPIMVPDGTSYTETDNFGHDIVTDNFKEDLIEAGKQMIVDALKSIGV